MIRIIAVTAITTATTAIITTTLLIIIVGVTAAIGFGPLELTIASFHHYTHIDRIIFENKTVEIV